MQSHCCVFALKVLEYLLDYHRIFDAGDDLDVTAAVLAGLDVDVENALQALRLRLIAMDGKYAGFAGAKTGHCGPAFDRCWAVHRICRMSLAAFGRRHLCTMRTVGGEYAMTNSSGVNLDARSAPAGGAPRMARHPIESG